MVTALYRRYRPETFAELIGQSHVTDPLRTALRTDRVNHAYLFSGPRGCGKTTSARILARCLNCVAGPTDTPCGVCPSCVELSRDGGGSLDVVEIDAASHNGVDDARDLRERAVFAPARDRFKIFILDEAHMVTPQGFNALLKIVEEPPEHVKFIFATTEPDKVIGTIRSRTHHYPFRLVPPAQMLDYVQQLCDSEGVRVDGGVLPLVVRAGGGSVRDTLSLLDQLIAGSVGAHVDYERAVALLGYTHAALLDDVVEALGAADANGVFASIDRVIQTGQDPRRFVEDLLERLRDLIIIAATHDRASAVLRGIPTDEIERMSKQATAFGQAELSRTADIVNDALTEMTGATSPRLHLELMAARILVPASDDAARGALVRVERIERRLGVADASNGAPAVRASAPVPALAPEPEPASEPALASRGAGPAEPGEPAWALEPEEAPAPEPEPAVASVTLHQMRAAWPQILDVVQRARRSAWMVVYASEARALDGDVLTLLFASDSDVQNFKQPHVANDGVSEVLRRAIIEVLGIRVKFIARVDARAVSAPATQLADADTPPAPPLGASAVAPSSGGWAVAAIPRSDADAKTPTDAPSRTISDPAATSNAAASPPKANGKERYGESVVREILGASFIEEQTIAPRVAPVPRVE